MIINLSSSKWKDIHLVGTEGHTLVVPGAHYIGCRMVRCRLGFVLAPLVLVPRNQLVAPCFGLGHLIQSTVLGSHRKEDTAETSFSSYVHNIIRLIRMYVIKEFCFNLFLYSFN